MADFVAGPSGGVGGVLARDDPPDGLIVAEVRISSGEAIDSIEFIHEFPNGDLYETGKHGGDGGVANAPLHVGRAHWISEVRGWASAQRCVGLSIALDGDVGKYWDFGHQADNYATFHYVAPLGWEIIGFYGRTSDQVDAFGVVFGMLGARGVPIK